MARDGEGNETMPVDAVRFVTSPAVSSRMSRQRVRDTAPEIAVRRELFARGERFRVCYPVPGRGRCSIDVAFPRRRVAVFVDGCFWHGCPEHKSAPKTNASAWSRKLERNRTRDAELEALLVDHGWSVVRAWEHEDPRRVCDRIQRALAAPPTDPERDHA